jgi:hypothetical protein
MGIFIRDHVGFVYRDGSIEAIVWEKRRDVTKRYYYFGAGLLVGPFVEPQLRTYALRLFNDVVR